jgi:hypothetical protein
MTRRRRLVVMLGLVNTAMMLMGGEAKAGPAYPGVCNVCIGGSGQQFACCEITYCYIQGPEDQCCTRGADCAES